MAFKLNSQEFKATFTKVDEICTNIISNNSTDNEIVKLAQVINDVSKIFYSDNNLSIMDNNIITVRNINDNLFKFSLIIDTEIKIYHSYTTSSNLDSLLQKVAGLIYIYIYEFRLRSNRFESYEEDIIDQFMTSIEYIANPKTILYSYVKIAQNNLAFWIIKDMLNVSGIQELNDLNNKILEAKTTLDQWDEKLADRQNAVNEIESKLKNIKQQYDFVLLNKGFKDLYEQKKINLEHIRDSYSNFGASLILTPVAVLIVLIIFFIIFGKEVVEYLIYIVPPVTTFMIMMFYFARVMLQDKRALQSQMIQIELRMALCQFIQNYAEETESLHKKNEKAFEKFESLIFSPIVSSDDNIPSTIDGVDQLVRLIEAARK